MSKRKRTPAEEAAIAHGSETHDEEEGADPGTTAMVVKEELRPDVRTWTWEAPGLSDLPEGEAGAIAFANAINVVYRAVERRNAADLYGLGLALNLAQGERLHERLSMTWEQYLDARFELPRSTAHEIQRAARVFTQEQVALLGISRANALASLSDDERAKLLAEAPKMTVRQLRAAIVQAREPQEPSTSTALAVRNEEQRIILQFSEMEGVAEMKRIGPHHAIGVLKGMHGSALYLAIAPDEDGYLELHVTPVGISGALGERLCAEMLREMEGRS